MTESPILGKLLDILKDPSTDIHIRTPDGETATLSFTSFVKTEGRFDPQKIESETKIPWSVLEELLPPGSLAPEGE